MARAGSSYAQHQAAKQAARAAQQAAREARKATRAGQASAGAKGGGGKPAAGRGEQTKAQIQKLKAKAGAQPEDTGYEPTGYEPTGYDAAQAREEAKGPPVFSERPVEGPDLPTTAQKSVEVPSVAPNALNQENAFTSRFNPNPGATPSGHIPLTTPANNMYDRMGRPVGLPAPGSRPLGGPTAENLAAAPFSPQATNRDWMPSSDHYNAELIRMGITPNTVGGAPIVNGKLVAPSMNELQVAMNNVADLQKMHQDLTSTQHRLIKWKNDPEGALALQPKISQLEEYLGGDVNKLREASLAQSFKPLQQVYNEAALKAVPNATAFKAQMDAEGKPAQVTDLTKPIAPGLEGAQNTLADRLKKKQGLAWSAPFDVYNQNLPTEQAPYL